MRKGAGCPLAPWLGSRCHHLTHHLTRRYHSLHTCSAMADSFLSTLQQTTRDCCLRHPCVTTSRTMNGTMAASIVPSKGASPVNMQREPFEQTLLTKIRATSFDHSEVFSSPVSCVRVSLIQNCKAWPYLSLRFPKSCLPSWLKGR